MPLTVAEVETLSAIKGACKKITNGNEVKRLVAGMIFAQIVSPACIDRPDILQSRVKDAVNMQEALFAEIERRKCGTT